MITKTTQNTITQPVRAQRGLQIPSRFGCYEIIEHLGMGGMGDVYKGRHTEMERLVALKILPSALSSVEFRERFNSEALAISQLQHHNIVTIYDYGEIINRRYIAMQYIEGATLAEIIKKEKKLSYDRIINFSKQVCRGLKYAHEKNIIHRDVKAGNIMVNQKDSAILSDFGLAQIPGATRLTNTGMAMGTPEYMAPEQCEGKPIDGQCDIYGLGIVMYEMVTGSPPFTGDSPLAIAYKQVHESPPLISKIRDDIPPTFELIIAKCLKKKKAERYKNAIELLSDLDSVEIQTQHIQTNVSQFFHRDTPLVNKRITDRRNQDRRFQISPQSRNFYFIIIGVLVFLLAGLLFFQNLSSRNSASGVSSWMQPHKISIVNTSANSPSSESIQNAFDHSTQTAWTVQFSEYASRKLILKFNQITLISGVSFQLDPKTLASWPEGIHPVAKVTLINQGQKESSFFLMNQSLPQFFEIKTFMSKEVTFIISHIPTYKNSTNVEPSDISIKDIRFLGLPY
ncbi:MAG: serine/threonine protein kinase [Fibrobacteria bacterium]|nr:serine/threonine protein kinase [Fibrobacteria bacterium]